MNQDSDLLHALLETTLWPPRWHCGAWTSFHGWVYILSDAAIALAYFVIPFLLVYLLRKRTLAFSHVFLLFGAFIFACGTTHLLDAAMFWWPAYRLNCAVRFFTAIVSWVAVFALYRIVPLALQLRTTGELEAEVAARTRELEARNADLREAALRLQAAHEDLEVKVKFRNLELEKQLLELQRRNTELEARSRGEH